MANVPQLALCLQEKGLIQSVKILQTADIPSMMMHPSTLDTSNPVDHVRPGSTEPNLFSPQIMETNASALLRFLKANCTQNNSTYLLRREPGDQPDNIQLYDISSISAQRQRKWIWWLATMSFRFALRLRHLEQAELPGFKARAFRDRKRSLYQTTLDLLQDLLDMDGNAHESLVASVREHMADTYLFGEKPLQDEMEDCDPSVPRDEEKRPQSPPPVMSSPSSSPPSSPKQHSSTQPPSNESTQQQQPYAKLSVDALNKAHDHLVHGIKTLKPVLEKYVEEPKRRCHRKRGRAGSTSSDSSSDEDQEPPTAILMQLFGLNYKAINVSLRLAEHHLRNYYSSSAMQALRNAARRMADSASLLEYFKGKEEKWIQRLKLQYTWLWEHCGHFARSFASDELWRDRGHACGDDVISVLIEVEAALAGQSFSMKEQDPFYKKTRGMVSLQSLSAVIAPSQMEKSAAMQSASAAKTIIDNERQLLRDKRQVLVASCISYSRAISAFQDMTTTSPPVPHQHGNQSQLISEDVTPAILNLLRQRLGDACNETGKVLLASLRTLLTSSNLAKKNNTQDQIAAEALLDSAKFWFQEGLEVFGVCNDLRNLALLRCNLCQCYKLRANSNFFTSKTSDSSSHSKACLQEAADHLQAAHEALGQRDVDPMTWDMVSEELAATFLVLAVRRRQSLLGGGNTPVILQALRLSPGKERSIMEPMERALEIYEQSGNAHQAAAVHYQLALTNSKIWTCQRDEVKTREKLSAAFQHYNMAFTYFSSSFRGNEPTFVLLCLDLASLYAAVAGEECLTKALSRCLDTNGAFSQESVEAKRANPKDWSKKMETLASSVEDRIFKLLRSLVKLDSDRYKDLYREGLTAKMVKNAPENDASDKASKLLALHDMLIVIRNKYYG